MYVYFSTIVMRDHPKGPIKGSPLKGVISHMREQYTMWHVPVQCQAEINTLFLLVATGPHTYILWSAITVVQLIRPTHFSITINQYSTL